MATLQASLLSKPSLPFPFLSPNHSPFSLSFPPTRRVPSTLLCCTFRPEPNPSELEPEPGSANTEEEPGINSPEEEKEGAASVSDLGLEEEGAEALDSGADSEKIANGRRLSIVAFFVGLWVKARESLKRAFSELLDWWPFWRQEKRLERLVADADANPQDAAKQSALLVELNKQRCVCVCVGIWKCCCSMNNGGE